MLDEQSCPCCKGLRNAFWTANYMAMLRGQSVTMQAEHKLVAYDKSCCYNRLSLGHALLYDRSCPKI